MQNNIFAYFQNVRQTTKNTDVRNPSGLQRRHFHLHSTAIFAFFRIFRTLHGLRYHLISIGTDNAGRVDNLFHEIILEFLGFATFSSSAQSFQLFFRVSLGATSAAQARTVMLWPSSLKVEHPDRLRCGCQP